MFSGIIFSLTLGVSGWWVGTVLNPASGKCLHAAGKTSGAKVQLFDCMDFSYYYYLDVQHWVFDNETLVNAGSHNDCLEIYNPDKRSPDQWKDGTDVQLHKCTGEANQHWVYRTGYSGGYHMLINPESNKCLDIRCPQCGQDLLELNNGTPVQIANCDDIHQSLNKVNQDWTFNLTQCSFRDMHRSCKTFEDDFIAVNCDDYRADVHMVCPADYEPILDEDSCIDAMQAWFHTEPSVFWDWDGQVIMQESEDMPRGCYQQLSTCGRADLSALHLNRASYNNVAVNCSHCLQTTLFCKRVAHDLTAPVAV